MASKLNASIILPSFAACLLVLILTFCSSKLTARPNTNPSEALQALFTVIAPTSVAWPREYAHLVAHSTSSRSKTISISMTSLINRVCDGAVEIRNFGDLPDLFAENLLVYGCHLRSTKNSQNRGQTDRTSNAHTGPPNPNPPTIAALSRPYPASPSPQTHTRSRLHPFLAPRTLPAGTPHHACAGHVRYARIHHLRTARHVPQPQFILCAVPFLPHKHAPPRPKPTHANDRRNRTATPLLASLHRVLELLTAGPGTGALALENVSNVSTKYAEGLTTAAERLEDDSATRAAFIHQWGEGAWREQRLMLGWEAALYSAGLLTRWVVIVRK
ncbi:hypothetical protein B0H13DRAFT_2260525 [Mycena leptocephala]|nr:hypothetical protein B0H13DRAFT_2260525 [Mycena leptocephala]